MEFMLSEEQRALQESISRFLTAECPLDRVRKAADAEETYAEDVHQGLCALGISGILVPEEYGGVGLGFLEAALVAEALGGAVAPVPYTASCVMAPIALRAGGSAEQQDRWLPGLAAGEICMGVGLTEQIGRRESQGISEASGLLTGRAMFVIEGMEANAFIVADNAGTLYIVEGEANGLTRTKLKTIDRTRSVVELNLDQTPADVLEKTQGNPAALHATIDAGRLMLAADTLGSAQEMLDQSIAYAKERRQFNRPIGSFQAVKHMCAEMAAELEPCRSLIWYAAHSVQAIPDESRLMICHAKAHLGEIGEFVARTATEVHGGMGFTDLLGLHYWFKRNGFNRQVLGAPEMVREEAARLQDLVA
jgi:alkylation response protein AidB-like acyl-CoA dehydrogenase